MDPATATLAVLSTITGISGYGAYRLNSKAALAMDDTANQLAAQKIEKVRKELALATEQMKSKAERELKAKQAEVDGFKRDIEALKTSKGVLESKLQSATELEQLYRFVSLSVFRKSIKDFGERAEIKKALEGLAEPQIKAVAKVLEKVGNVSRLSLTRGSAQAMFQELSKASGREFMPRVEFDKILMEVFKSAEVSSESAPPAPEPAAPEPEPAAPEPESKERDVPQQEIEQCREKLDSLGIKTLSDYRKWMLQNKTSPDIPIVNNCVDIVLKGRKGGLRKKKLRSRRGGKQRKHVRRTRRS